MIDFLFSRHFKYGLVEYFGNITCLGLAASYRTTRHVSHAFLGSINNRPEFTEDETKALELCRELLLGKYKPRMILSERVIRDALIQAAARGYAKVVSFLGNQFPEALGPLDSQFSIHYCSCQQFGRNLYKPPRAWSIP